MAICTVPDMPCEARSKEWMPPLVGLNRTPAFLLSGLVLHAIFWQNLSADGGDRADGPLATAIEEHVRFFEDVEPPSPLSVLDPWGRRRFWRTSPATTPARWGSSSSPSSR